MTKKTAFSVLGAILIGLVGSAIWDLFLKAVTLRILDILSEGASLGIASLRDIAYKNASQGSQNDALFAFCFFLCCWWFGYHLGRNNPSPLLPIPPDADSDKQVRIIRRRRYLSELFLFALFISLTFQIGSARLSNKIIDDFRCNMSILIRVVEPREAADLEYSFSQMASRDDFESIKTRMISIANNHAIQLPRWSSANR